jgi:hypothetical protein
LWKSFESLKWDTLKHAHSSKVVQCDTLKGFIVICFHPCHLHSLVGVCVFVDWSFNTWYVEYTSIWDQVKMIFIVLLYFDIVEVFRICVILMRFGWAISEPWMDPRWDVSWSKVKYKWVVKFTKVESRWVFNIINVLHLTSNSHQEGRDV